MDSLHEAHLERILENRRRRGVLVNYTARRGPSTATQTEQWAPQKKLEPPMQLKSDLSPSPRIIPSYATADEAAPHKTPKEAACLDEATESTGRSRNNMNGQHGGDKATLNHSAMEYSGVASDERMLRYGGDNKSPSGRSPRWGADNSRRGWRSSRNPSAARIRNSYNSRKNDLISSSRSPGRTVPRIEYGSSERQFSSSRGWDAGDSYRSRNVSPHMRYSSPSGGSLSQRPHSRPSENHRRNSNGYVDSPLSGRQPPSRRQPKHSRGDVLHRFPDERDRGAAGSVIYSGDVGPLASPARRRPPGPPLPQGPPPSNVQRNSTANTTNNVTGLPGTRSTIDIRTSVSILAAGDWFYKWNSKGTTVSPRWVWLDAQSHLLLWAHRETYENSFAGTIKLEKIVQVASRELQQLNDDGVPQTYYVILVETTRRVLQLATERRVKADVWCEALNNVLSYLRALTFGSTHLQPASN
ncbi:hypothetical protein DQ04_03751010 [Trypanosoma grayi]|uniref:hypothetical protein n=1 Tax=Trypanosoma grayi TaxID=71804 RepID=UPI0004F46D3D|nr:hypothetical protein DQ04_03751010 [Trypanosoma grayi]KEG10398.1 hypothetical protein DQ04_03751010 [Trypanosoma grayi]